MYKCKMKSSSSILKRFKVTANGKSLRRKASRSHLLQKKTTKRKHRLRQVVSLQNTDRALLTYFI